jgi:uncharacterized protein (DUF2252 family)
MARSAHAFVRGNTARFYSMLGASNAAASIPAGPAVWICGDCHLGNLGPLRDADGKIEVQIRDLDQTVIGNPAYDLIRLGLSLASAARGSDLPGVAVARMVEAMIDGYDNALADPEDGRLEPEPDVVRTVRRRAFGRKWRHLARERIADVEPSIPLGRKFWPLDDGEREAVEALFDDARIQKLVLSLGKIDDDRPVRLVDAAYWMKGCSSLGLPRIAAIVAIKGAKDREAFGLVDIKGATNAVAPYAEDAIMPANPADRVVAGALALSPNLGERMAATELLGQAVFVRELAPQDLKLEVDQFSRQEAIKAARYLAHVVGKAHARQMTADQRATWRNVLNTPSTSDLDAPSWLWGSIVQLSAGHESAYLEHCRRYALGDDDA